MERLRLLIEFCKRFHCAFEMRWLRLPHAFRYIANAPIQRIRETSDEIELWIATVRRQLSKVSSKCFRSFRLVPSTINACEINKSVNSLLSKN